MKRLLIVITRMYAQQGDNKDEFVEIWQGAANTEHRIFALQTGSRDDYVLVLHGYEYPQQVQAATSRARVQVEAAIKSTELLPGLPERRTGVMFHPRQSWTPVAQMEIADGMNTWLRKAGAVVDYVQAYHHGSIIDRKLAPACIQRQDFSSVLDELWGLFLRLAVAGYARRLENLTKELTSALSPLCREKLRGVSSDSLARPEKFPGQQTAHAALTRARHMVLDEGNESDSIVSLVWEVADRVDEQKKERLISALAELEKLFSQTDPRYQAAVSSLEGSEYEPEASGAEKTLSGRKLDGVRSKLAESDSLTTWCQAMFDVLAALRQILKE